MGSVALRDAVILRVLDQLDEECVKLCQVSSPSLFSKVPASALEDFDWEGFYCQLGERAPLLLQMLSTIACRNDHRNQRKAGEAHHPGICMAAAVILKERTQRMTGVQSVMSFLLFASHVDKQVNYSCIMDRCVYERFLSITLSRSTHASTMWVSASAILRRFNLWMK